MAKLYNYITGLPVNFDEEKGINIYSSSFVYNKTTPYIIYDEPANGTPLYKFILENGSFLSFQYQLCPIDYRRYELVPYIDGQYPLTDPNMNKWTDKDRLYNYIRITKNRVEIIGGDGNIPYSNPSYGFNLPSPLKIASYTREVSHYYEGDFRYNYTDDKARESIESKQNILVSGENIKTINGESILGGGDLEIQGGGASRELTLLEYTQLSEEEKMNGTEYFVTDAYATDTVLPFKFGITADGRYGYYKTGEDTVTPFAEYSPSENSTF